MRKSSDVPFTGTVTGKSEGKIKNGQREGPWVDFHSDGTKRMSEKKTGTIIFDEGSGFYRNGKKVSD